MSPSVMPGGLVRSPGTFLAIRAALASPFLASGILKLCDWSAAIDEFEALNIPFAQASVAIVVAIQIAGSLLLIAKRHVWLNAGMLASFTVLATLIAHPFWNFEGAQQARQLTTFLEHLALVGGLAAAAVLDFRSSAPRELSAGGPRATLGRPSGSGHA